MLGTRVARAQGARIRARGPQTKGGGGAPPFAGENYTFDTTGWITAGKAFPQGAVPAGQGIVLGAFSTQNDVKRTWPDGSARLIVFSANVTSTGTHLLQLGTPAAGSFSPTAPTVTVDITPNGGTLRTATFSDTGYTDLWLNGPLVKETKQVVSFASATGTLAHVRVHFYVRSYSDGTHRVFIAIDNSIINASAGVVVGSLDMKIGGSSVYSRTCTITAGSGTATRSNINELAFTFSTSQSGFFTGANVADGTSNDYIRATSGTSNGRIMKLWKFPSTTDGRCTGGGEQWVVSEACSFEKISFLIPYGVMGIRRFSVGGHSRAQYQPGLESFYAAGAMFRPVAGIINKTFSSTMTITDANVGGLVHQAGDFEIFNYGIGNKRMSGGGDRPELTMQPEWCLLWELYKTQTYWNFMLDMADQFGSVSKHAHKSDGTPYTLVDDVNFYFTASPHTTAQNNAMFIQHDGAGNGSSHMPDMCFIPYLVTGDRYYAEQVRDGAVYGITNQTEERRSGMDGSTSEGLLWYGANEKRSIVWAIRDLVHYLAYCPDGDANRSWLTTIYNNNVAEEAVLLAREPDTLGASVMMGKRLYDGVTFSNPAFWGQFEQNTFEDAYTVWVFEDARRHGYLIGQTYLQRHCAYHVNAANANSGNRPLQLASEYAYFPWGFGSPYNSYASLTAFWSDMITNAWGTPGKGLYTGANGNGVTYATYGRIIFMVAERLGLSGASTWLSQMESASPNYESVDWQSTATDSYGRQVSAIELN